ncbi:MAG: reverse transcriptase family protein [Candidatus Thiodiazotropha sp. (ex Monitilora ramsayi)]|nr:reverse transcriptase family protein [Candidatus Thiodiazotropha sp. (ex Monitilora ramsayi)]
MSGFTNFVRRLAISITDGGWDKTALTDRLTRSLNGGPPDPEQLAARLIFHFDKGIAPSKPQLIRFFQNEDLLHLYYEKQGGNQDPIMQLDPPVMGPLPDGMLTFPLPQLSTWKDLRLWLGLSNNELAWFADTEQRQRRITEPKLHHYYYRWFSKQSGPPRLIEIPKTRIKSIQRQILKEILNRVPPHQAVHGFTRGRSSLTYVSQHIGKDVVLHMDLKDFFHSVPTPRIGAMFQRIGYPRRVARLLQGLCTHATSASLAGEPYQKLPWDLRKRLAGKHLPQGAPTSPAIANLCAWRFDCRLQGVANHFGLDYTRYADDLAFSGPASMMRMAPFLQHLIGAIAIEEDFEINHRKTRVNTKAQSQRLVGMVVNEKPNLPRAEFDQLKAILYNCVRLGPESQNRQGQPDFKAHLAGRIAYTEWLNPARGKRLRSLWKSIPWTD